MQAEHARNDTPASWRDWLPRFSLRQLLLATTFVAIGCYALRWASPWWSIVLFYTNVMAIVGGLLVAVNWPGEQRAFWLGFVVCGLAHWLLAFHPGFPNGIPPHHPGAFGTHWFSAWSYQKLRPWLTVEPVQVKEANLFTIRGRTTYVPDDPNAPYHAADWTRVLNAGEDGIFRASGPGPFFIFEADFCNVALGLWTLLLGYVGGRVSLVLYRCRGNPKEAKQVGAADS